MSCFVVEESVFLAYFFFSIENEVVERSVRNFSNGGANGVLFF